MPDVRTMRTHITIDSPLGPLTLVNTDGVLSGLYMEGQKHRPDRSRFGQPSDSGFEQAARELTEYFSGRRSSFSVPLRPAGNAFERSVWRLLFRIPYGHTRTYGQLAAEVGDEDADWTLARAVGTAVGHNPIGVIIPCHRVIGADGSLTGYAGGLERKAMLLDLERPPPVVEQTLFEQASF
ncbi:MAG TPA: methylated-DNA--[protein]-cysteine S-methyltransferase [Acidimicrobiales bacterium]|nr:methylated-DNA--[protein]-cysteine S-methyltransferase [Acidimicrobiales bacterium]